MDYPWQIQNSKMFFHIEQHKLGLFLNPIVGCVVMELHWIPLFTQPPLHPLFRWQPKKSKLVCKKQNWSSHPPTETLQCLPIVLKKMFSWILRPQVVYLLPSSLIPTHCRALFSPPWLFLISYLLDSPPCSSSHDRTFASGVCSARSTAFLFQSCHGFNLTLVWGVVLCCLSLTALWALHASSGNDCVPGQCLTHGWGSRKGCMREWINPRKGTI